MTILWKVSDNPWEDMWPNFGWWVNIPGKASAKSSQVLTPPPNWACIFSIAFLENLLAKYRACKDVLDQWEKSCSLVHKWSQGEKKGGKLGQHQSQIPFLSAFWVQKDFGPKKMLDPKKCWVKKMFGPIKCLVQKNILGPKFCFLPKFGEQKRFISKTFWVQQILG